MQPDVFAAAEASGVPWAALVHTLGQRVLDDEQSTMLAFAPLGAVNDVRATLGLAPVEDSIALLGTAHRILVAGPEAVDRPRHRHDNDDRVRYLGTLLEPPGPDATWTPPTLGRSLVVASLGTTPMDEAPVVQRVLDAAASLPDLALFATVGDHLDPSGFVAPPNARVGGLVRHAAVLPYAAVLVTHAGLGTVTSGLAHGLPMLCLPLGRDQHDNAARVEGLGAGITLPATSSADEIAAALERLLCDDAHRAAAGDLAGRIADESPPRRAVDELVALAELR
jgi:UDP:flavonoid glycosyltransferase YjiC (YdhE family)